MSKCPFMAAQSNGSSDDDLFTQTDELVPYQPPSSQRKNYIPPLKLNSVKSDELNPAQSLLDILAIQRKNESVKKQNNSEKKAQSDCFLPHDRDSIHMPVRVSIQEKKLKAFEKPVQYRILIEHSEADNAVVALN